MRPNWVAGVCDMCDTAGAIIADTTGGMLAN